MTVKSSNGLLSRKGAPRQRLSDLDAPLRPIEGRLIGHLLGRREDAAGIAQALGLTLPEVDALCERLLTLGLLKVAESHGRTLYSVH